MSELGLLLDNHPVSALKVLGLIDTALSLVAVSLFLPPLSASRPFLIVCNLPSCPKTTTPFETSSAHSKSQMKEFLRGCCASNSPDIWKCCHCGPERCCLLRWWPACTCRRTSSIVWIRRPNRVSLDLFWFCGCHRCPNSELSGQAGFQTALSPGQGMLSQHYFVVPHHLQVPSLLSHFTAFHAPSWSVLPRSDCFSGHPSTSQARFGTFP